MRILVIGASQGTGALAVEAALSQGHEVTAFARSPQKLTIENRKLRKLTGDFHVKASVDAAVAGHDAVIVTASSTSIKGFKENPHYFSSGTTFVVDAMKRHGVRRIVVLSALGTGETRRLLPAPVRFLVVDRLLKYPFADHVRQEELTRASGLEWVIVRPGRLTNGPARLAYKKTGKIEKVPAAISRADVADFLVEAATTSTWVGQGVQIGG